jgi:hypothetical protein
MYTVSAIKYKLRSTPKMWQPVMKFFSFVGYYPCFLQLLPQNGQWRSVGSSVLGAHSVLVGLTLGRTITVFTQMQDDSNQRRPRKQNTCAEGKYIHPNLTWPSKNKISVKKKYFTNYFINSMHKACQILSTYMSLYLLSQCLHLISNSLLTLPSYSLPFHNISSI